MDFWIGDTVKIQTTGEVGKFEGELPDGQARIKLKNRHITVSMHALTLLEDEEEDFVDLFDGPDHSQDSAPLLFKPQIDLHIEVLDPDRAHDAPFQIRDFQIKKCEEFIQQAIKVRATQITIIHGKGTGALKSEILHVLNGVPEVFIIQETNHGGAQECIMNYRS